MNDLSNIVNYLNIEKSENFLTDTFDENRVVLLAIKEYEKYSKILRTQDFLNHPSTFTFKLFSGSVMGKEIQCLGKEKLNLKKIYVS